MWASYPQHDDFQNPCWTLPRTEVKSAQQISRKHEKYIFEKTKNRC